MTKRLQIIFDNIPTCPSFADIGCDHGFIAQKMIESGKCNCVTVSDISPDSLEKAKKLLKKFIDLGQVTAICTNGLLGIDPLVNTVLIAGMGGEEIIKILNSSNFLPPVLVLQPMKNTPKVRSALFDLGYAINKDFIFYDKNKYYNLLVCKLGDFCEPYSSLELTFGRDNLKTLSSDFLNYLQKEIEVMQNVLERVKCPIEKEQIQDKIKLFMGVLYGN